MDLWAYDDLKLLPMDAFFYLAEIFKLVENGAPWPRQVLSTKAHLLSKDATKRLDPLQYRCLTITPVIFRLWAKIRLKHMAQWIQGWAHPSMFAGLPGRGASDAWYLAALEVELAQLEHNPLVGGALDLYRRFDQIVRPLLYASLVVAGCPTEVLTACIAY